MIIIIQTLIGREAGLAEVDCVPAHTVEQIKQEVCKAFGVYPSKLVLCIMEKLSTKLSL